MPLCIPEHTRDIQRLAVLYHSYCRGLEEKSPSCDWVAKALLELQKKMNIVLVPNQFLEERKQRYENRH